MPSGLVRNLNFDFLGLLSGGGAMKYISAKIEKISILYMYVLLFICINNNTIYIYIYTVDISNK